MRLLSVNRGSPESLDYGDGSIESGINKHACSGAVLIGENGLQDDAICDLEHHGGADQAIYAYGADDYEWWSAQLATRVLPGTFGDNLTIAGLAVDMNVGDRLLIGDLIIEASGPRIPCSTLAAQMRDRNFGIKFRRAERPGFYFRVLNPGEVVAGDSVTLVENPECDVSMLELFRLYYDLSPNAETLQRVLEAPVAERLQKRFAAKLAAMNG